ncbi:MAG TPA: diguanylate cyclase [Candidatus Dormibacteraeota bacterium]|nr:diguanylate cyclase [Candidatus Dormibacteraeota bacterium]HEV2476608.1 diguanylate cyclase [Candidatus Dormibacteraeota bacterium]
MPSKHDVLEAIPDAVVVTDRQGNIVFVNRAAEAMTGYERKALIGRAVETLVPERWRGIHVRHRRTFYGRGAPRLMGDGTKDFSLRRKDGAIVPVEISLGPVGADTVAVVRDVTERRRMEAALEHRALHDPLTDLPNRSLFFDRLRQALHAARRDGSQVALVMLDLDGFKAINDTRGHATGDAVLREVAARLRLGLRATDSAARLGGDEFAWILPRVTSRRSVEAMVRKRLAVAQEPVNLEGQEIDVGVSAGIAMYPDDGQDPDTLMRRADRAMYSVKRRHHVPARESEPTLT